MKKIFKLFILAVAGTSLAQDQIVVDTAKQDSGKQVPPTTSAVETVPEEPVSSFWESLVTGSVQPSDGVRYKGTRTSVYAKTGLFYDSNVYGSKRSGGGKEGSAGWNVTPGIDIGTVRPDWGMSLAAYLSYDEYFASEFDPEYTGSERFTLYKNSEKWRTVLTQTYTRTKDISFDNPIAAQSGNMYDTMGVSGVFGLTVSEKTSLSFSAGYNRTSYEAKEMSGYQSGTLSGELSRRISGKTDWVSSASVTGDDGQRLKGGMSYQYSLMSGIGSRLTEKVRYRILAGLMYYEYDGGVGDKQTQLAPSFSGNLTWQINRKWAASWMLNSGFQPSYSATYSDGYQMMYGSAIGVNYAPTRRLSFRLDGATQMIAYEGEWGPDYDKWGYNESVRMTINYIATKYCTVFASANYSIYQQATPDSDYDRFRGDLGLTFRY